MSRPWVAFDTETTGLEPGCRLIELAAVQFDKSGNVQSTFQALCDPGMPLPEDITTITGLVDKDLAGQATATEVLKDFRAWLPGEAVLFAHNVRFDCDVLGYEWDRKHRDIPTLRVVDTVKLGTALRGIGRCRLQDLVQHFGFQLRGRAHRALPDADATRQLVLQALRDLPSERFNKLIRPEHRRGHWSHPRVWKPPYDQVRHHLARGDTVRFTYTDGSGNRTTRTVDIYGYARTPQGLRFHGYCHLRQERRNFALERVDWLDPDPEGGGQGIPLSKESS